MDYTREELIDICERAIVPLSEWSNRDTSHSQRSVGECWALLKAGCDFHVRTPENMKGTPDDPCVTDDRTIWLAITFPSFATFDQGAGPACEIYYLPTPKRLQENSGTDWY